MKMVAVCMLSLGLLAPVLSYAQPMTKQQVISQVKSQYKGRVLSADLEKKNPPTYKVKVLQADGRVKVLRINANRKQQGR